MHTIFTESGDFVADEAVLGKIRAAEKKAEDIVTNAQKQAEGLIVEAKRTSLKLIEEAEKKISEEEEKRINNESAKTRQKKAEELEAAKLHADGLKKKSEKNIASAEKFLFEKFLGAIEE